MNLLGEGGLSLLGKTSGIGVFSSVWKLSPLMLPTHAIKSFILHYLKFKKDLNTGLYLLIIIPKVL